MKLTLIYKKLTLVFDQGELELLTSTKEYFMKCAPLTSLRGRDGIIPVLARAHDAAGRAQGIYPAVEEIPQGFLLRESSNYPSTWGYSQMDGVFYRRNRWGLLGGHTGFDKFLGTFATKSWSENNSSGKCTRICWEVEPEMAINILEVLLLSDVKDR